jgi:hypothetical protein
MLANPGADDGNDRVLLSAFVIPALVQRSLLGLPSLRKRDQQGIVLRLLLYID